MKKAKIIILLIITIIINGCNNEQQPVNKTIEEQISQMQSINLNNAAGTSEKSPYYIENVTEIINPAITYTNKNVTSTSEPEMPVTGGTEEEKTTSEENLANINISRSINFELKYDKNIGETPEKIILNYVKLKEKPKKGKIKLHAIKEGDYYTYIEQMRKNEITSQMEYEKDISKNKLKNGNQHIRFSVTIDEIVKSTTDELTKNTYLEILKTNKISKEDLKYKIEFAITIYTKNDVYALKLEFESMDFDIYEKQTDFISYANKPLYLKKLE